MKKGQKVAIGVGGLLALLAAAAAARAATDDTPDIPTEPDDPIGPIFPVTPVDPVEPVEPPPVIPQGQASNYVGSGWSWSGALRQAFPAAVHIGNALARLGYPINYTPGPNANTSPFNMISQANMTSVREFQRDYNVAVLAQTVDDNPNPAQLDDDALVANQTMRAILNAERWVDVLGVSWSDIVSLA